MTSWRSLYSCLSGEDEAELAPQGPQGEVGDRLDGVAACDDERGGGFAEVVGGGSEKNEKDHILDNIRHNRVL